MTDITINASDLQPFTHYIRGTPEDIENHNTYTIRGDVPEGVDFSCFGNLKVEGSLGSQTVINAMGSAHILGQVGEHVTIDADSIELRNHCGGHAKLTAHKQDIRGRDIGSDSALSANTMVLIGALGNHSKITCNDYALALSIAENCNVTAAEIRAETVGRESVLTATDRFIRLRTAAHKVQIWSAQPDQTEVTFHEPSVTIRPYTKKDIPNFISTRNRHTNTKIVNGLTKCGDTYYITQKTEKQVGFDAVVDLISHLNNLGITVTDCSKNPPAEVPDAVRSITSAGLADTLKINGVLYGFAQSHSPS